MLSLLKREHAVTLVFVKATIHIEFVSFKLSYCHSRHFLWYFRCWFNVVKLI